MPKVVPKGLTKVVPKVLTKVVPQMGGVGGLPPGGRRGEPPKRTKDSTYYTFHYAQILPQRHFARWFENHYARNR